MFDTIYKYSKLAALLCVLPLTFYVCVFLNSLKNTSDQLATVITSLPAQVDDKIGNVQTAVLNKIDTVQDKLNTEVTTVAALADRRIGALTTTTDDRLAKIQNNLIDTLNVTLNNQLTTTNQSITKLVDTYAAIPNTVETQYNKNFASFFDCRANKLCLQGQASDTMFAVRQSSLDTSTMMMGFNETMPKIENHILSISDTFATNIPTITTNIAGITDNINKLTKPKWYDRIIGYGLSGLTMYRELNPVTNITTLATEFMVQKK